MWKFEVKGNNRKTKKKYLQKGQQRDVRSVGNLATGSKKATEKQEDNVTKKFRKILL